jgi:hypothetical protein
MAADIDLLLSRLQGVKKIKGSDKWVALCPAHDDKTPSLSIRQLEDSRILINCWSGCGAIDVLESIDMNYQHLMPDDAISYRGIRGKTKNERLAIAESILEMLPLWQAKSPLTESQKAEVREAFLLVNGGKS